MAVQYETNEVSCSIMTYRKASLNPQASAKS